MEEILGLTHNARVALYARVSTEEQREGQTIDSQIAELEHFARERGWVVVGTYKDDGWSGSRLVRPALEKLRDDASQSLFQAVLINDVDRLARDVTHLGIVKRDLERHGARVIFRKLPADNSPTHNLMVNVLGSFAEFERELIADRTRRGRRYKVEVRQQFLGSIAPYGFRYIKKDLPSGHRGSLQLNLEEEAVVRQMYAWVDQEGLSARKVAVRLNQLRIRPRHGRRGWGKSSVLRILRSETYAGVWHYNKHEARTSGHSPTYGDYRRSLRRRPRSEWLPVALPESLRIIPREQWERVQQQLDRNTAFSPRNDRHGYLLKGLLRCGACGARYSGQPCHGRFYYRCLARCKRLPSVEEDVLNDTVWHAVEEAILNPSLIARQVKNLAERTAKAADAVTIQHADINRAVHQIENEELRILESYRLGVLSPTQLAAELDRLNVRKASLNERRATLSTEVGAPPHSELRRSIADFCRLAAQRIERLDSAERQRFLQLLVREVIFEGDRVRIQAIIQPGTVNRNRCDTGARVDVLIDRDDIATTQAGSHGRNPPDANPDSSGRPGTDAKEFTVPFEIVRSIPRLPHSRPFKQVGGTLGTSQAA